MLEFDDRDFDDDDIEDDEDEDAMDQEFSRAADHVQRTHNKRTPNELLELYGLYKQATVGKCNTDKPGIFNMQGRAKWSEWQKLGDISNAEAKKLYVKKVMEMDEEYHKIIQQPNKKSLHSWVVHSIHAAPQDEDEIQKPEHEKTAFDFVKEKNLEKLKVALVQDPNQLNKLDEHGMGLIHWAADRDSIEILEYLLSTGADVNLKDADSQTALHFAASCGHLECVQVLIKHNADLTLKDSDGQTCLDVADCSEICSLLSSNLSSPSSNLSH